MNVILIAVISIGVIALVAALVLYVASKKFAVYEDPRIAKVTTFIFLRNSVISIFKNSKFPGLLLTIREQKIVRNADCFFIEVCAIMRS